MARYRRSWKRALGLFVATLWGAAIFSLASDQNNTGHVALYAAAVVAIPALLPWLILAAIALRMLEPPVLGTWMKANWCGSLISMPGTENERATLQPEDRP